MALPIFPIRKRYVLIGFIGGTAALTYFLTLSLIEPKKIDLRTVNPPVDSRQEPTSTAIPNRWSAAPVKPDDSKLKQDKQNKPVASDTPTDEEVNPTEQPAGLPAGCSVPPGGGPPVNAAFEPC